MFKNILAALIILSNVVLGNQVETLLTCLKIQKTYNDYGINKNVEYPSQCLVENADSAYYTHYISTTNIKNVFWVESFGFRYSTNKDSAIVKKKVTLKKNNVCEISTYVYSGDGKLTKSYMEKNNDIVPGTNLNMFVNMYKFIMKNPKFIHINEQIKSDFTHKLDSLNLQTKQTHGNISIEP